MKSKYIKPSVEVLEFRTPLSLLADASMLKMGVDDYEDLPGDEMVDAE